MSIKDQAAAVAKTAKLEDHHGTWRIYSKDSRLHVVAGYQVEGSIDLPGDLDSVIAMIGSQIGALIGAGKSEKPSSGSPESSGPSKPSGPSSESESSSEG